MSERPSSRSPSINMHGDDIGIDKRDDAQEIQGGHSQHSHCTTRSQYGHYWEQACTGCWCGIESACCEHRRQQSWLTWAHRKLMLHQGDRWHWLHENLQFTWCLVRSCGCWQWDGYTEVKQVMCNLFHDVPCRSLYARASSLILQLLCCNLHPHKGWPTSLDKGKSDDVAVDSCHISPKNLPKQLEAEDITIKSIYIPLLKT